MLTRRTMIACAVTSPLVALPIIDPDIKRLTELSGMLQTFPLSARHRVYVRCVRRSVVELPLIDTTDLREWAYEHRSRLTSIIGLTQVIADREGHLQLLWISAETCAAGMSIVRRVDRATAHLLI